MNHVQIKWNAVTFVLFIIVVIFIIVYYLYLGMPMFYIMCILNSLECTVFHSCIIFS